MIGSLIYLTITRPNISYVMGVVSAFMHAPRKPHLDAVRKILRYVKGIIQFGLHFRSRGELFVQGYINVDWARSIQDRRLTSGYSFSLGSATISWASKKQPTMALSSTKAEYRGAMMVTCEAI